MIQVSWDLFFWGCFIWILTEVFLRPDAFPSKVWHQTLTPEDVLKWTPYWSLRVHLRCDSHDNQVVWLWRPVDVYQCSASTYLSQGKTHLLRLWLAYPLLIIWSSNMLPNNFPQSRRGYHWGDSCCPLCEYYQLISLFFSSGRPRLCCWS